MMLSGNSLSEHRNKNMDKFNQVLSNIELTPKEEETLLWLCGWNASAVENVVSVMEKVKNHDGQAETADKLYEALNTIKEHCALQGNSCKGCLLSTDTVYDGCDFLDENPVDWDLGFLNQATKKDPAAGTAKVSK
ncbi:hypothetical protein [Lacrimispora sp.]|uniref:hypothetical protein n=1 Tax=Lacrimispora sp. TaxID=2719234 RepID=UPI0034607D5F